MGHLADVGFNHRRTRADGPLTSQAVRRLKRREAIRARGAALKLSSAPILVWASAAPGGNAAVVKKRDTVKPIAAVMPTTTTSMPQPIEAHPGRSRIIDAWRERPHRELDQLFDEERNILRRCPRGANDECGAESVAERIVHGARQAGP